MMGDRPPRIACLSLPHAAAALEARDDARLAGKPVVVVTTAGDTPVVYDVSYGVHAAGVTRGMTLAAARQQCPDLIARPLRPDAWREAFEATLAVLAECAPAVEPAGLDQSWLVMTGMAAPGPAEQRLAEDVVARVQRAVGLAARVGVAHGKLTSRIITQYLVREDAMVLPAGREVVFLGGLSTRYLPLASKGIEQLRQLGVTKIHAFAALPARGILPRFGYAGLRAYELAHGVDDPRVQAWSAEPFIEARHVFPDPIANHRSLRFRIERLVGEVTGPLRERYRVVGAIRLAITFDRGEPVRRARTLLDPTITLSALMTHIDALCAGIPWGTPVAEVAVGVRGLCATPQRQLSLFREAHDAEAGAEDTLERLQARYGPDVVRQGRRLDPRSPLHERRAEVVVWRRGVE